MNVAKTYINWEKIGEPFTENKKTYIFARKTSTSAPKKIRVYTDIEYAKLYPAEEKIKTNDKSKTYKEILGFVDDYIIIFRGDIENWNDYFSLSPTCRYATLWGWYIPSNDYIPQDLPSTVTPIKLSSSLVFKNDNELLPIETITENVNNILYPNQIGNFIGKIGDKINQNLIFTSSSSIYNGFGTTYTYNFTDEDSNLYQWNTSVVKDFTPNKSYSISATIKELKTDKNKNINILTRARIKE